MHPPRSEVPVFVLCGGLGTRLREETELRPKPMVPVGNRPILWHIMRKYSQHGFNRFILCLGYKAEVIKSYFLNYASMSSDFTVELKTNRTTVHSIDHDDNWNVTLADTGELTMTGARVAKAAAKYLGDALHFAVTYGDGLTDANLGRSTSSICAKVASAPFSASTLRRASASSRSTGGRSRSSARSPTSTTNGSTAATSSSIARSCRSSKAATSACSSASRWSTWQSAASSACTATAGSGPAWIPSGTRSPSRSCGPPASGHGPLEPYCSL